MNNLDRPSPLPKSTTYASVAALAAELGLSRQVVYRELRAGNIPAIRLGRRFVIPRAAIQAWLESAGTVGTV